MEIQGDRALSGDGIDRLSFRPTALRLAEALTTGTSEEGFVVGVVGEWGSGKSSLLNLTKRELERSQAARKPHVIEFKPWLIGDRDALLQGLFSDLIAGIDQIEYEAGDATGLTLRQVERATAVLRDFAERLGELAALTKTASSHHPGLAAAGDAAATFFSWFGKKRPVSLAKSKAKVSTRLKKMKRPLVVIIDDVDRLEPAEIVEVLRLVRSVADFPNVIYVLSYDLDIVAHAIRVAARVRDGHAYVEKIVQIAVHVPTPEAFELRRWFEAELKVMAIAHSADEVQRIDQIINNEGGTYFDSPRAVIRTLDSIRFNWSATTAEIDFSDFLWLQIVKVGNPTLFGWISRYLSEISARSTGPVSISAQDVAHSRASLDRALTQEGASFADKCGRLSEFIPGISSYLGENDRSPGVFEPVYRETEARSIRDRRLSSPDHYRLYLAFGQPANSPSTQDFADLTEALNQSHEATVTLLRRWQAERLTSGVTKAELVLDRLSTPDGLGFTADQSANFLRAFAGAMDDMIGLSVSPFVRPDIWVRAKRSMPGLLVAMGDRREEIIREMFTGRALGWLSSIFREETFAHGRYGDRPSHDRLFLPHELDVVSEVLLGRYRLMEFNQFAMLPEPINTLFAWQQGGDNAGPRDLLESTATTGDGLVHVLEVLSGTSFGALVNRPHKRISLSRNNLGPLMDRDEARLRVELLAETSTDEVLRFRAERLLGLFDEADRFPGLTG